MYKKLILLVLFTAFCTSMHAQYVNWMIGTWKSRSETGMSTGNFISTMQINNVIDESFTGTITSEINDGSKIIIVISGAFKAGGLYLQNGEISGSGAANGQLHDCSGCAPESKMIIRHDSLMLVNTVSGCNNSCDGKTFYYRLLSEYDDDTQRYLVDRFGRPSDIIGFRPYKPEKENTDTSANNNQPPKTNVVVNPVVINPDIEAIKREEKRRRDSTDNIVKVRQQQANDSIHIAMQRKRQQEINDSLNLLHQREQQRTKDSLSNVAKIKQQQADDSARLAQKRNREQAINDSLNLVHQKQQQRTNDSLNYIARLEQSRIQREDSLRNVKRQQQIADSLNLANQKRQQYINDSLQTVAGNLQKQRTADSLRDAQAKKRQQEITDSLAVVSKQQYNDSLQKAALAKASIRPPTDSSSSASKVLTDRTNVLLGSYHITTPDILIELFDNGEIDGDRVSVYHNNAVIVSNQTLGIQPITINIHADATNREHEFILVAENLGSIPPNSALMRVTAGNQVYRLSVNTDMKTNARIIFYYDGN